MRRILALALALSLPLLPVAAPAAPPRPAPKPQPQPQPAKPQPQPQPAPPPGSFTELPSASTSVGRTVEVVEFFGYFSPVSYAMDRALADWLKENAGRITLRRLHVVFAPSNQPAAEAHAALELIGKADVGMALYEASHVKRISLTAESILDVVVRAGVDKAKFNEAIRSFAVQTRARATANEASKYGVEGLPTFVVDGRFKTTPSQVGAALGPGSDRIKGTLDVLDHLIARGRPN